MRARIPALAVVLALSSGAGCAAILGLDDPRVERADASTPDVAQPESSASEPLDASDAAPDVPVVYQYSDITQKDNWEVLDLALISLDAISYGGGAFDKRWVYFSPSLNAANTNAQVPLLRFDTLTGGGDFKNLSANWQSFNARSVHPRAKGFGGAVVAGKYVYYVPFEGSDGSHTGLVLRFDTTASSFQATSSLGVPALQVVDLQALFPNAGDDAGNPGAAGYMGAVYDGQRFVYFVPGLGGARMAARLDTTKDFQSAAAWTVFDTTRISPADDTRGFVGGVVAGDYVYFVPRGRGGYATGLAVRYDMRRQYDDPLSWEVADTSILLGSGAIGFMGGVFDGRYVYFAPYFDDVDSHGRVVRFDTQRSTFATNSGDGGPTGWEGFDIADSGAPLDASVPGIAPGGYFDPRGYSGGAFDGRFVYFVPSYRQQREANEPAYHGLVAQYDTTQPFAAMSSWHFFDMAQLTPKVIAVPDSGAATGGFWGAVFDGQYVYFMPSFGSYAVRYLARTPKGPPPFGGSFY